MNTQLDEQARGFLKHVCIDPESVFNASNLSRSRYTAASSQRPRPWQISGRGPIRTWPRKQTGDPPCQSTRT